MSKIAPCLWFDGQAEDAARFWISLFANSALGAVGRYGEGAPFPAGTALLAEFTLGGRRFQALNGGPHFKKNASISFFAHVDTIEEAKRLYEPLAEGGSVLMPLAAYPWSPQYAWVQDRFGTSWQIIAGRRPAPSATVVPCLMFSGPQHGRAKEAMERLASLFPDSHVDSAVPYGEGEGPSGTIKHGSVTLAGERFSAMDSHVTHDITFNEGISLSVDCDDQAEVDRLWDALCDGGAPSRCGWLKDRFGISWQIVPKRLGQLQTSGDAAAKGRVFKALMAMGKIDVEALERAHRGEG